MHLLWVFPALVVLALLVAGIYCAVHSYASSSDRSTGHVLKDEPHPLDSEPE